MEIVKLGNGNICITQTVSVSDDEVSLTFSQLEDVGKVGERLNEEDIGQPICKIQFDDINGLDNLLNILNSLRKRVYRNNCFYKKMLP